LRMPSARLDTPDDVQSHQKGAPRLRSPFMMEGCHID
jgi:hypothetical protein